ncbi:uncharacterized protein LOC116411055 [Xenopus tropicalis]|uniref:Uncharacterized protein LOC116411055 n=1 Tax=Xenopus tropicalis TaxID=8364 RepID=A0A8J1JNS9_XENTR|nr:uncharacterized protein LOC116411055 [Xenopus tropicalis]
MAAEDGSVPVFVHVKHSVRIVVADPLNQEKNLVFVVRRILEDLGRVSRKEILAIQDYPRRGVYDVTFDGEGVYRSFLRILEENSADPRLEGLKILPHFAEEEIFLVVKTYSPFVPLKEIETVLSRYCKKLVFSGKILNELGIWTSKYRFKAVLDKGVFPPARFRLGTVNIDCFFNGMPEFCRRCRQYCHVADGCVLCQNCGKATHMTKNCVLQKRCNLCFQMGHLYAGCPQREKVESQKSIHEDLSASPNFEVFADPVLSFVLQDKTTEEKREEKENLPDVEMESELGQVGKVLEFLSDFDLSASPNLQILEENLSEPLSPVSEEGHFHVTGEESPAGKMLQEGLTVKRKTGFESLSRGEKLYRSYKGKSIQELKEVVSDWSDEEEYGKLGKYFEEIPNKKEARKKILRYIKNLK